MNKTKPGALLRRGVSPITIFATPKAFQGHFGVIQRNAITSWTLLKPRPEIFLFGTEYGTGKIAAALQLRHIPDVKCNELGTPLISDMFMRAQEMASHDIVCYCNSDIILLSDFMASCSLLRGTFAEFLMIGRHWNAEITDPVDFKGASWETRFREFIARRGHLHRVDAIDYFLFTRHLYPSMPPFSVGRPMWDNWVVYQALITGRPVVDATKTALVVHQNHDYSHKKGGRAAVWEGIEAKRNRAIAGKGKFFAYTCHATWELTSAGLRRRRSPPKPGVQPLFYLRKRAMARYRMGVAQMSGGRLGPALAAFNEALLLAKNIPLIYYAKSIALIRLHRAKEAIEAAKVALRVRPGYKKAQKLLVLLKTMPMKR